MTPRPLPPDLVQQLVRQYEAGHTLQALADRHAMSYRKVRTTLLAAGVVLRPTGVPPLPAAARSTQPLRLDRALRRRLNEHAAARGVQPDEVIRELLARELWPQDEPDRPATVPPGRKGSP